MLLPILLTTLLLLHGVLSAPASQSLPEIKYADLLNLDIDVAKTIVHHLTSLGGAQITGIPSFDKTRKRALEDLAVCLVEEKTAPSAIMADGSKRLSTGAASIIGKAGAMDSICGEASKKLRASVDSASFLLFQAMDLVLKQSSSSEQFVMGPHYNSYSTLFSNGNHLEHLHSYYPSLSSNPTESLVTLDYHVDAGLMIAMTTGYYQNIQPSEASGLYMKLPNGEERKVIAEEDALIILMGDGAARWLAPVLGKPFRGLPHKLVVDLPREQSGSRSWYGKMYLPPADAIIPQEDMKYSEFNKLMMHYAPTTSTASGNHDSTLQDLLPSACGSRVTENNVGRMMTANDDNCPAGQLYCWARCMPTTDLPCGDNAVCWNSDTNEISPGDLHCSPGSACNPTCIDQPSNSTSNGYCIGTGTSMFMQGFVSIVSEDSGATECVNLWFTEWTLDSKVKYGFACIGVFLFCIFIQYLHTVRSSINKITNDKHIRVTLNVLLYGVNVTCGYFAMLVAMTYSVELFCMICVGMTVGYGIFHADKNSNSHTEDNGALESESVHQPLIKSRKQAQYVPPPVGATGSKQASTDDAEDYGNCCSGNDTA